MPLSLYNTLTLTKERFKPIRQEEVKVYYCGPTPYNYAHIGNLRAYLFSDSVVRTLRFLGYKVRTVMNITDIDDKTIRDSQKNNETLQALTERFSAFFLEDLKHLHVNHADTVAPISTLIPEMVEMIQKLLDRGYAYLAEDGSVYYSIKKFKHYGELAHLDMKGMKESVRVNNDEYDKEQAADFVLWKAYDSEKDGPNKWEAKFRISTPHPGPLLEGEGWKDEETNSPLLLGEGVGVRWKKWGWESTSFQEITLPGRPGWHIECSACNMKFFGPEIDIHMGGVDNIFPHHQNEIAQSEAANGKKFARYWMHAGHLLVDNKKMAKSVGNFYTLRDIVEKLPDEKAENVYRGFRLMSLQTKYRENFNFTFDRLQAAIATVGGFDEVFRRLRGYQTISRKVFRDFREALQGYIQAYVECLEDDISTPEALAIVFDFVSFVNTKIDERGLSTEEVEAVIGLFRTFDEVLGLFDFSLLEAEIVPEFVAALVDARRDAKAAKDFALADKLRTEVTELGYRIVDNRDGTSWAEKV